MKTIFIIFTFIYTTFTFSQIEFKASVNKNKVTINEIFTYTISTNSNCQIYQPNFNGLQVLGPPSQSSKSSTININGQISRVNNISYTFNLRATKAGKYTIGSAQMKCATETHNSKSIIITVSTSQNQGNQNTTSVSAPKNSNFFIRLFSDKNTVYEGEPFVVTLKMFSRKQPRRIEDLQLGETTGITKQDLHKNQTEFETKSEIINGLPYYTVILKQELCYAKKSGKLLIKPYYISALFNRGFFQQYRQEANSNPLTINAKKLPNNKPENFNGLVGKISLKHTISKTKINQGEAIDFNITISGNGNLNSFDDPILNLPSDIEQFDPEIKNNIKTNANGTFGSITYNYVLVPTFYGDFTIPAYSFSYFDIESKSYKTLSTGKIEIHVNKSDQIQSNIIKQKKEISIKETDIRFIHKKNTSTYKNSELKAFTFLHFSLIITPFFILWLILFIKKQKNNLTDEDIIKLSKKKAKKTATKYLINCKNLQTQGKDSEAIKALSYALKSFLKHKLNIKENELNTKKITSFLKDKQTINQFNSIWNTIEMYQYSPVSASQIDVLTQDTEALINTIDKQL